VIKQRKFDPTVPLLLHPTAGLESMRPIYLCRIQTGPRLLFRQQAMVVSKPSPAFAALRLHVRVFVPLARSVWNAEASSAQCGRW
jgi:hypothetical protein